MQVNLKVSANEEFAPTSEELDYADVENTCGLLDIAGRDCFSAESLFHAMTAIGCRLHNVDRRPISKKLRDRMLAAIVRIENALSNSAVHYDLGEVSFGFDALANQIVLCAETPKRSAQRPVDEVKDINAYARIFRNRIHNVWLSERIMARMLSSHFAGTR